jgi:hypothetical protein
MAKDFRIRIMNAHLVQVQGNVHCFYIFCGIDVFDLEKASDVSDVGDAWSSSTFLQEWNLSIIEQHKNCITTVTLGSEGLMAVKMSTVVFLHCDM